MCFDFLYRFVWKCFIRRRSERDMIVNVYWSSCKVPVIIVSFKETRIFSKTFFQKKKLPYQFSWKYFQWQLTDGRTDRRAHMTKVTVPFRNFGNAPKKGRHLEDLNVDGSLIQKFDFKKKDWMSRTGFISLRLMTTGGPWWNRN